MPRRSISNLTIGEKVDLRFNGSKNLGNLPYTLEDLIFVGLSEDGNRATFCDGDPTPNNEFTVYKLNRRWRYGSSSETLKLLPWK